jgi:hypothetical protein
MSMMRTIRVHVMGDSTVQNLSRIANVSVTCMPGATCAELFKTLLPEDLKTNVHDRKIIMSVGTNDIGKRCTYEELHRSIMKLSPYMHVWVMPRNLPASWYAKFMACNILFREDVEMEDVWIEGAKNKDGEEMCGKEHWEEGGIHPDMFALSQLVMAQSLAQAAFRSDDEGDGGVEDELLSGYADDYHHDDDYNHYHVGGGGGDDDYNCTYDYDDD